MNNVGESVLLHRDTPLHTPDPFSFFRLFGKSNGVLCCLAIVVERAYVSVWSRVGDIIIDTVVVHYHNTHV